MIGIIDLIIVILGAVSAIYLNYIIQPYRKYIPLSDDSIGLIRGYIGMIFATYMMCIGAWR